MICDGTLALAERPRTTPSRRTTLLGWVLTLVLLPFGMTEAEENLPARVKGPVSPEESLKHLVTHPALKIELVAAEPEVIDPVAMAFDERGRLWVVEMSDYPNGPAKGESPKSRIKWLEDRDGDGRFETAHVFADQLLFATGVQPWKGGVIVTMAGQVAYLRDTDGDGKADERETWFTGFTEENPQLRANHPTLGLDHQIYVANGLRGGTVIAARDGWKKSAKPVSISGRDFRFDPLTGTYSAISGVGQFGLTFDAFGNRFTCSNRNPCIHVVLESSYLERNPLLAVKSVTHDVSPAGPDSRVYPLTQAWTTSTLHAGQFTAACGVTLYQGDGLPQEFQGNSFTCEPTGNLVHRDVVSPDGATFSSRPGREGVEFLASRDAWFRPVNLGQGPDGALYVVDTYRAVIEHPQFMPTELKTRADLTHGNDRGRIYRLVPKSGELPKRENPKAIADRTARELANWLDHPNGWQRDTAARLILERQDAGFVDVLKPMVTSAKTKAKTPEGRVRVLWALEGLNALTEEILKLALDDSHPRVLEQAVRLSEDWLAKSESIQRQITRLASHPDARLRFQVALSLGSASQPEDVVPLLAKIALAAPEDEWTRAAVLSSLPNHVADLLETVLVELKRSAAEQPAEINSLLREVAEVLGSRNQPEEVRRVLTKLAQLPAKNPEPIKAVLIGLGEGQARRGQALGKQIAATEAATRETLTAVFQEAARKVASPKTSTDRRLSGLDLMRFAPPELADPLLMRLATGEPNQTIRLKAIQLLARSSEPEVAERLLTDYRAQSPAVRRAILDCLLADNGRTKRLLEEIALKRLAVNELNPAQVKRLTEARDAAIRAEAQKLLAAAIPQDRREVLAAYQAVLSLKADPQRGQVVFTKNCATCHKIGETGVNVAPDIADSRTRQPAALLTDVLDPNRAIDNNYFSYTVLTTNGLTVTGIIETETSTSLTLKQPEGKTVTILRDEIEDLKSDGVSLMPVGLEKNISQQEMADLISFIKNWRYLDGRVPIDLK